MWPLPTYSPIKLPLQAFPIIDVKIKLSLFSIHKKNPFRKFPTLAPTQLPQISNKIRSQHPQHKIIKTSNPPLNHNNLQQYHKKIDIKTPIIRSLR